MSLIRYLIAKRASGDKVILWTCRCNDRLKEAVDFCKKYGLEFDAVNENLADLVNFWGNDPRKISADVYIDDKAVNKPKWRVPYKE